MSATTVEASASFRHEFEPRIDAVGECAQCGFGRGFAVHETQRLRVLIACEFSGAVRRAFRALGHEAWSCDLLAAEDSSEFHYQGDVREYLRYTHWDLMIAHPPCTYLCRAGWHWVNKPDSDTPPLKGAPRRRAAAEAAAFFHMLLDAPIPKIAIENPRPIVHVGLPPSSQKIQPWMFGHGEVKETHLWLKDLPPLVATNIVEGRRAVVHKASPGPNRWMDRSRTYEGVARAMAEQWGGRVALERAA